MCRTNLAVALFSIADCGFADRTQNRRLVGSNAGHCCNLQLHYLLPDIFRELKYSSC